MSQSYATYETRIPSSVYPDVIYAMEQLARMSNLGYVGFVALMEAETTRPKIEVVTVHSILLPELQISTLGLLDPRDIRSMPRIQQVLRHGIRLLGQREHLAATVERLSDKITLAARETEVQSYRDPIPVDAVAT